MARCLILILLLSPTCAPAQPLFQEVKASWQPSEAQLLDRNGVVIHNLRRDFKVRRLPWTPLKEMSPALIKAIIAAEDRRFYEHRGVDWLALVAAAFDRIKGQSARGGSTITMQLAAMLHPDLMPRGTQRSIAQKLDQIRAGLTLEQTWSKQQILEAYLNLAGFRGELQGVTATAKALFGKQVAGLSEAEAVLLAALLPSPNAGTLRVRRKACAIATAGQLRPNCEEIDQLATAVLTQPGYIDPSDGLAPHLATQLLRGGGTSITTTLDAGIQRLTVDALQHQLQGLHGRNVRDGAALVVDNSSGDILAYVGSTGRLSSASAVDGVRALRQAGSTLKPFLYGLALEKLYLTAASILDDAPLNLQTATGLYIPQNYDRDFKGLVSVRTALASSLNIPSVRALMLVGVEPFRDHLHHLGYHGIRQPGEYYGFSLALGSADVSLYEQVNAYRTLANRGIYSPLQISLKSPPGNRQRVMSASAAFIISDILADRAARAVTFGLDNPLATRFWSAVKTGTSKDMRDNWCIGFTRKYTVGVWVGNFEGDSMHGVSGISGAAPAWFEIISMLHHRLPSPTPEAPEDVLHRHIRFEPALEPDRAEWFIQGTETQRVQLAEPLTRPPRIESPPGGVIIALDPDIPYPNQSVLFTARPAPLDASFVLNGKPIASAHISYKWPPRPGTHKLALVGAKGQVYDVIDFTVRGLSP